ncbi:hypothetical protein G6F37_004528 [Rhizopus arrhizus]|nr:hypothetical protein G6F38_002534 [Rhizopus arrhizus]KAG1159838.1 hypothetical protein G6F37_004528 [Rhizopus arrhizus]
MLASEDSSVELKPIPECDTTIDLTILKGDELKRKVFELIEQLFPQWAKDVEGIQLDRVSGAMTNAIFFVDAHNRKRLLLRVYGIGVDQIIDRNNELAWIARLSHLNIGPSLLGVFGNGRFEQYLPSRTLTSADIRTPDISRSIASCTRELHDIVTIYPPLTNSVMEAWNNVDKWYKLVMETLPSLTKKSDGWAKTLASFDLTRLAFEIEESKKILAKINSPIVFAHNDSQYGNVLQLEKTGELVIVDFEYAGYNARGYDIANHFCEWMYNYHSDQPAVMNKDQYPTKEEQISFLTAYINTTSKFSKQSKDCIDIKELEREVDMYVMVSHLFWGLWGLFQANQSEIDFDYFLYSTQRLNAFRKELAKWKHED